MPRRRLDSLEYRSDLAELAASRSYPDHVANEDERAAFNYALNFTKGLPHSKKTGLLRDNTSYELFVKAIDSGNEADFIDTPLGPVNPPTFESTPNGKVRAWESQGAGSALDLQGPDAQAVTMPPAPAMGGDELTAEMAEVYGHALLRDVPLSNFRTGAPANPEQADIADVVAILNDLDWFKSQRLGGLSAEAKRRRRVELTTASVFRGIAPGDDIGPYVSQFLLVGTNGLGGGTSVVDGVIQYGAQSISQKVPIATPGRDYMTEWDVWFDVQNGLDLRGEETYEDGARFITTGRDLATYVHYDALYQAYLNACLILLARSVRFDPGIPFQRPDVVDHQQGFAHFGGPHILSLVTEVATRALKAVRFQKFNVHRRLRPEALAARIERADVMPSLRFGQLRDDLGETGLLDNVGAANCGSVLLPMAFPEGSPMHPSYGAGHATVAGACVTVLKAFFDHSDLFAADTSAQKAFVANDDGSALEEVDVYNASGDRDELTVEGELNKLAANISIGRNWAGVHYFSDYWESLLLGEQIALQILTEQRLAFQENFSMTVPLFAGGSIRI